MRRKQTCSTECTRACSSSTKTWTSNPTTKFSFVTGQHRRFCKPLSVLQAQVRRTCSASCASSRFKKTLSCHSWPSGNFKRKMIRRSALRCSSSCRKMSRTRKAAFTNWRASVLSLKVKARDRVRKWLKSTTRSVWRVLSLCRTRPSPFTSITSPHSLSLLIRAAKKKSLAKWWSNKQRASCSKWRPLKIFFMNSTRQLCQKSGASYCR